MARRKLGRLKLNDGLLGILRDSIKAGFEARRGPLYNALRALNAFAIFEIGRSVVEDSSSDKDVRDLVAHALKQQMEKELHDELRFLNCYRMGTSKFGNPAGVVDSLEKLVPDFATEFREREAQGDLGRRGGLARWLLGQQEVGSIEDLMEFARTSIFFAGFAFDDDSRFPELDARLGRLGDLLPE